MIRNFALTLAAVILRYYMPSLLFILHWTLSADLHYCLMVVLDSQFAHRRVDSAAGKARIGIFAQLTRSL
jgi:hypothetical protein